MLIKIDFREHDLNTILIQSNVKIETCNLPIGDIVICDDTGKDILMIERKTLNDLASSICDGRYNEQSYRLNQCSLHNHAIFYLIEGDLRKFQPRSFGRPITKEILISSMTFFELHERIFYIQNHGRTRNRFVDITNDA